MCIRDSSYVDSKLAFGMIAALKFDELEVKKQFEAAMRASGGETKVIRNYSSALFNIHKPISAVNMIEEAVRAEPDSITILLDALDVYLKAQNVEGAINTVKKLSKLGHKIKKEEQDRIDDLSRLFALSGANWEDNAKRIELVGSKMHDFGFRLRHTDEIFTDEGIIYQFVLDSTIDEALDAQTNILDTLSELPYLPSDNMLSFSCVPYECNPS